MGVSYGDDTECVMRLSGRNVYGNFEKMESVAIMQSLVRTVVIGEAGKVKQEANHVGL